MIRTLLIIAVAALVLATASLGGAAALGGRDLARHGWAWTFHDDNGESDRFERVRGGGSDDLGPVVTRTLSWDGDQSLAIDAAMNVEYVQGPTTGVVVTGPRSLADRVRLDNGRLSLGDGGERVVFGWDQNGPTARSERDELRIVVTAPNLNAFNMEGSGRLTLRDYDQETLAVDISGSGEVEANGRTRALTLYISGSGDADLSGLATTDARVTIAGSGDARVAPTGRADISISGSGDVGLTTRPANVNQTISGSGDVSIERIRSERDRSPQVSVETTTKREIAPGVSVSRTTTEPSP